jgi:hypothetical protein
MSFFDFKHCDKDTISLFADKEKCCNSGRISGNFAGVTPILIPAQGF